MMHWREEYLHFIWKYQLFQSNLLKTTRNETVIVHKTGLLNSGQGPDFLHASIQIGDATLHGHIEIHIDNKDWYSHSHQHDAHYQNVILHVVLNNTNEAYTLGADHRAVPILCLQDTIESNMLLYLQDLMSSKKSPACQDFYQKPSQIKLKQFQSRLLIERILRKSNFIQTLIQQNLYHYENAFYQTMLYGFGIPENSDTFLAIAQATPQNLLAKYSKQTFKLEALLYGQAGLLVPTDDYSRSLHTEYTYLQQLHGLTPISHLAKRSGMLPASFPTIRIAQFVAFIENQSHLYSKLTQFEHLEDIYPYFQTSSSEYWQHHYDFGKAENKVQSRKLSKSFIDRIIINIILPFRFLKEVNDEKDTEHTLTIYHQLKAEQNAVTRKMEAVFGWENKSAYDSQVMKEWYSNYCEMKKCLECPIGYETLRKNYC